MAPRQPLANDLLSQEGRPWDVPQELGRRRAAARAAPGGSDGPSHRLVVAGWDAAGLYGTDGPSPRYLGADDGREAHHPAVPHQSRVPVQSDIFARRSVARVCLERIRTVRGLHPAVSTGPAADGLD